MCQLLLNCSVVLQHDLALIQILVKVRKGGSFSLSTNENMKPVQTSLLENKTDKFNYSVFSASILTFAA